MLVLLVAESGVLLLFLLCLWRTVFTRRDRNCFPKRMHDVTIIVSAALFALIFEDLNVRQISGRGSYSYHAGFHIFIDQVPLFIVLAWAVILWTAMQITNHAPLNLRARICADATLAVLLDLAFDATAIRHRFWTWHGVEFDAAWFGVPAGNFFGWLLVALAFSGCTRLVQQHISSGHYRVLIQLLVVPPLAFGLYRAAETTINSLLGVLGWNPETSATDALALSGFFVVFGLIVLASVWRAREYSNRCDVDEKTLLLSHLCRASFHLFAVAGLWMLPASPLLWQQRPALLAVAGLVWLCDWFYTRRLTFTSK